MSWNRRPLNHPFIFSLQPRAADRSIWLGGGDRLLSEKAHTSGDERPNSAPIIPLALKHPDVPRAQRTWTTAFLHNELHEYLNDVPDKRKPLPFEQQVKEAFSQASLHRTIDSSNKIILTVEQGASFIVVSPPTASRPDRPIDNVLDGALEWIANTMRSLLLSPEQHKREAEVVTKMEEVEKVLGDRVKDIWHINLLSTEPESQGKGYAGGLLDAIITRADAKGQAIWLFSSVMGVELYEQHGFVRIAQFLLGDNNPTWKKDPAPVALMLREPGQKVKTLV